MGQQISLQNETSLLFEMRCRQRVSYFCHVCLSSSCYIQLGYIDIVRALLAAGSNPTITNKEGATPFDYCTEKEILGVYNEELLQAAANSK